MYDLTFGHSLLSTGPQCMCMCAKLADSWEHVVHNVQSLQFLLLSTIKPVVLYTENYCGVGFVDHLLDDPMEDLELPEVVPPGVETNRKAKSFLQNLK